MTGKAPDPIVGWQIVADDPAALSAFYAELFGWTVDRDNALGYRRLATGSIDGGVWPTHVPGKATVQLFIAVADIEAHIARARPLGAKVLVPRSVLPDGDAMAILLDPAGLSFGLLERKSS
ncbi:MAG TPA: VOC family protein [Nannocystaceae bacterium]|nr:VOC family protein [Nannocystaceae bacterium]